MKIFFFYIGTPTPVLETNLELIREHEQAGDSVRVLQCSGLLTNCHWNPDHINSKCAMCRSKFKIGWDVLNPGENVVLQEFSKIKVNALNFPNFQSIDDIKKFKYDNENIGYGVVSSLGSIIGDHRFDTKKYKDEIYRGLSTAIEVYTTLKREFLDFRPDLVYLFNGRTATHLPAKLLCKRMGIEYITYEVSRKLNSYRLVKNASVHEVIPLDVVNGIRSNWNALQKKEAESFFIRKRIGKDFNKFSSFTKNQTIGKLPIGFNKHKKNIAIFNSTIDEYASIESFENAIYEPDETAGISKILETFLQDTNYMFYLRVHPNMANRANNMSQLDDIRVLSSKFSNLCVIWPKERIDSYALIDACQKIITFGSTTGVEATYWGKPSILANHKAYKNFGCAYTPKTHDELVKLLHEDLKPLPVDYALQYAYYLEILDGVTFKYFKETGFINGLCVGTFDNVEIKPSVISSLCYSIIIFLLRIKKAAVNPSLIFKKMFRQ